MNACDETTTYEHFLRVEDCVKPRPICVGLSSVVFPSSQTVTLWAKDFESGSSVDDCTARDDLLFSFSGSVYEPSREYDCLMVAANGSPTFLVEIWIADQGTDKNCNGFIEPLGIEWSERNRDYCTTFLVFDDPGNECIIEPWWFSRIATAGGKGIEDVRVEFINSGGHILSEFTNAEGYYQAFVNPLLSYLVLPSKNDDVRNGVSTLDLIKLQKHLLGTELLDSPYDRIAADANASQSISVLDLIDIRKVILGVTPVFPNNQSWRFVHESHQFMDPAHPWPFPESTFFDYHDFDGNFTGVKIGDVNGSTVNLNSPVLTKSPDNQLLLRIKDTEAHSGMSLDIPVHSVGDELLGFQLTMLTHGLIYQGIGRGLLEISSENIAAHTGAITMSWANFAANTQPVNIAQESVLFTMHFLATESGKLSEMLEISSTITEAGAYGNAKSAHGDAQTEILNIALQFDNELDRHVKEHNLYQNTPNPFLDQTKIGFDLPAAMSATITVLDVHGRAVRIIEGDFAQGYNEVVLKGKELGTAGAYYYRLNAGDFTASKRLILSKE
jgi:hypothetical protein